MPPVTCFGRVMPYFYDYFGRRPVFLLMLLFSLSLGVVSSLGQSADLDKAYRAEVRPLLDQFCFDCHADDDAEADIDLDSFQSADDIRRNTKVWVKVDDML